MFTLDLDKLTPEQRAMVALWEEHMKAEFQDKDARASCDTTSVRLDVCKTPANHSANHGVARPAEPPGSILRPAPASSSVARRRRRSRERARPGRRPDVRSPRS